MLLILFSSSFFTITSSLNSSNSHLLNNSMILELEFDFMNVTSLKKVHCKPGEGLNCGAKKDLDLGSQFLVSSRQVNTGLSLVNNDHLT